jgi:Zn-dependent membrane protease YugP
MLPFFDPTMIILIPGIILGLWAQMLVKSRFHHYSSVMLRKGLSAAKVARMILDAHDLQHVPVEHVAGHLSDHFDPTANAVRLSDSVYQSSSVAAAGIAAHEVGHAIQYAKGYGPIQLRNMLFPLVQIANFTWLPLFMIGIFMAAAGLMKLGIILFSILLAFQVFTLPVEFDASSRAIRLLPKLGITTQDELDGVKKVLSAAALTYVAAALTSLLQLLRLLMLANGRNRD